MLCQHHSCRICKLSCTDWSSLPDLFTLKLFSNFQKIRTVNVDGKTIKLHIVNYYFSFMVISHIYYILSFFSGTPLGNKHSTQARIVIEGFMVSLSYMIALTKSLSKTSSIGYMKSIAMLAKTSTNCWLVTNVIWALEKSLIMLLPK